MVRTMRRAISRSVEYVKNGVGASFHEPSANGVRSRVSHGIGWRGAGIISLALEKRNESRPNYTNHSVGNHGLQLRSTEVEDPTPCWRG